MLTVNKIKYASVVWFNGINPPFATLKKLGKLLYIPLYQTHQESTWWVCWKLFKLYVWSSDYSFKRSIYHHHHITTKYFYYPHLQGMYPKMLKRYLLQFILLQLRSQESLGLPLHVKTIKIQSNFCSLLGVKSWGSLLEQNIYFVSFTCNTYRMVICNIMNNILLSDNVNTTSQMVLPVSVCECNERQTESYRQKFER